MKKKMHLDYFRQSLIDNQTAFLYYYNYLWELATSTFEWLNLPETVDERYIEMQLFETGSVVYFDDEIIGNLCLTCIPQSRMNVYGEPILRRAYSRYNNYNALLKDSNSVIVWNNRLRTNGIDIARTFARKLALIDRTIDINVNAQKTPLLVQGTETQKLTLVNMYKEYDGNAPVIFGNKNLDINGVTVLKTDSPYICDKLTELKEKTWNEALTRLGIPNVQIEKKERLITDEVQRALGGVVASRYSRLEARQQAVERINKMFGTNIEVRYREEAEKENSQGGEYFE